MQRKRPEGRGSRRAENSRRGRLRGGFALPALTAALHVLAIVVFCVLAAVVFGVVHDQVTARVCVEYFTIGHPQLFAVPTDSPTLLGLGWGVVATWWVGLLLGIPLAVAARAGRRPPLAVPELTRPIAVLFGVAAGCAVLAGLTGYALARAGIVVLLEPLASRVPAEKHVPFIADLWAHATSYLVGFVGGTVVIVRTWRFRRAWGGARQRGSPVV